MIVHMIDEKTAKNTLKGRGYSLVEQTGRFVSACGSVKASIMPVRGSDEVAVSFLPINNTQFMKRNRK